MLTDPWNSISGGDHPGPPRLLCYFRTPSPIRHTIGISLNPEERPLEQRCALLAINPEEMMRAVLAAIARDTAAGVTIYVLEKWRAGVGC